METMGNLRRTHYCGTLRARDAGTQMTVAGSIAKCRDKGGVIFADLRDTTGILQLIFDDSTDRAVFEKASGLKSEYVVIAAGTLREREAKTDKIPTGEVELFVTELRVLSGAQTTPFEVRDGINVNDQLRLKYRYLDLRRPSMHEPIVVRSKIAKVVRDYYDEHAFCGDRDSYAHQIHARGRARLSGAQPCAAGAFLCAAPVAPALQADFDALRL